MLIGADIAEMLRVKTGDMVSRMVTQSTEHMCGSFAKPSPLDMFECLMWEWAGMVSTGSLAHLKKTHNTDNTEDTVRQLGRHAARP